MQYLQICGDVRKAFATSQNMLFAKRQIVKIIDAWILVSRPARTTRINLYKIIRDPRCSCADTYVKTYLRENDRWLQKRKTRVVRHNCNPEYNQTLRYSACDVMGRSLLVMLWERQKGFEHNQGLGGAEVTLDDLKLTQVTEGWYSLFPIQSLGSDSNDSPWRYAVKCSL